MPAGSNGRFAQEGASVYCIAAHDSNGRFGRWELGVERVGKDPKDWEVMLSGFEVVTDV